MDSIRIIGIDASKDDGRRGVVLATYKRNSKKGQQNLLTVDHVGTFKDHAITKEVERWINDSADLLIAIDCPMGWPRNFEDLLVSHFAGCPMKDKNDKIENLFPERQTDQLILEKFKKNPLHIASEKIARTAFSTLNMISGLLGDKFNQFPLIVNAQDEFNRKGIIEVYPAATLISYGLLTSEYLHEKCRKAFFYAIEKNSGVFANLIVDFKNFKRAFLAGPFFDRFDALICCVAATDFLDRRCLRPEEGGITRDVLKKEGFIWVKHPDEEPTLIIRKRPRKAKRA